MTKKELLKRLEKFDDDMEILISRDEEGNGYNHLETVQHCGYEVAWGEIEVGLLKLTPELKEQGYAEEDVRADKECLVLWP